MKIAADGLTGNAFAKFEQALVLCRDAQMMHGHELIVAYVAHDHWCAYLSDVRRDCDCEPDLILKTLLTAPAPWRVQ